MRGGSDTDTNDSRVVSSSSGSAAMLSREIRAQRQPPQQAYNRQGLTGPAGGWIKRQRRGYTEHWRAGKRRIELTPRNNYIFSDHNSYRYLSAFLHGRSMYLVFAVLASCLPFMGNHSRNYQERSIIAVMHHCQTVREDMSIVDVLWCFFCSVIPCSLHVRESSVWQRPRQQGCSSLGS